MAGLTTLIIDDDQLYITKLKSLLSTCTDRLLTSPSAENGVYFVSVEKPDLIFLDNKLPNLQGNDVIQLYKESSPESKVILMSNGFNVEDVAIAIEQNADFVVSKEQLTEKKIDSIYQACIKSKRGDHTFWSTLSGALVNNPNGKKKHRTVAIVDDDAIFAADLNWQLEKSERFTENDSISTFSCASSFYNFLNKTKPDVVFLDFNLGKETGLMVLKRIHKHAKKAKVIMVSAQNNANIAMELFEQEISGYIVKNSDWKEGFSEYMAELGI